MPSERPMNPLPHINRIQQVIEEGSYIGFCLSCGAEMDGCEPDATKYRCEVCEAAEVYGAEECLISGMYRSS